MENKEKFKYNKFIVFGLGLSGLAVVDYLHKMNLNFIVWDTDVDKRNIIINSKKVRSVNLKNYKWKIKDCLILSPGIPKHDPIVINAIKKGTKIIGDIELFWEHISIRQEESKIIGVTGTNGKSSVVKMISQVLNTEPIGNIGNPVLRNLKYNNFYLIELSSFQLDLIDSFRPNISVLTNLKPDHIDHHGSYIQYINAKKNIYKNQNKNDFLIVNVDDKQLAKDYGFISKKDNVPRVIPVSTSTEVKGGVMLKDNIIIDNIKGREVNYLKTENNNFNIKHNLINFALAYAVGKILDLKSDKIIKKLLAFRGLPHRLELLGSKSGVDFIDDSKATNVAATDSALSSFNKLIWIAGGKGKGDDYTNLLDHSDKILGAYFIGEVAFEMADIFKRKIKTYVSTTLDKAVRSAYILSLKNNKVPILLSPACSSYDQYMNYKERGLDFKRIFNQLEVNNDNY